MISSLRFTKQISFFIFFSTTTLILSAGTSYCSMYPFDEYDFFCSYFKMSGDKPADQDIEDLCFTFDRPTYTSFKPSEMFTRKSLNKEKIRVDKRIKSISSDSTYLWKIKPKLSNIKDIDKCLNTESIAEILPHLTPYINSKISRKGQRKIKKAISSLLTKCPEKIKEKDVEIFISLKTEKSENGYQKRNIIHQNVVLPIRYVIFQPLKVQILDELEIIE